MPKLWKRIDFWKDSQMSYQDVWDFQKSQLERIVQGEEPESLIFCEHEELITKGRRSLEGNLLSPQVPVYEIERGGDYTWHGPGQLVIYPLFRLQGHLFQAGLHEFLRFCEESIIQLLESYGLEAGRFGPTGVWIKNSQGHIKKIASIGIAVRKWVTYHGISLNVSNFLSAFSQIRPCNFDPQIMTSLEAEGVSKSLREVADEIEENMHNLILEFSRSTSDSLVETGLRH